MSTGASIPYEAQALGRGVQRRHAANLGLFAPLPVELSADELPLDMPRGASP